MTDEGGNGVRVPVKLRGFEVKTYKVTFKAK
jgi:hypothetical protein